ncbi:MAG TPA: hypothetical protein VF695_11060 [Sphingomonas sp.]|jgi:hypothetical protein
MTFQSPITAAPEPKGRLRQNVGWDAEHATPEQRLAIGRAGFNTHVIRPGAERMHECHRERFAQAYAAITRPFGGK